MRGEENSLSSCCVSVQLSYEAYVYCIERGEVDGKSPSSHLLPSKEWAVCGEQTVKR